MPRPHTRATVYDAAGNVQAAVDALGQRTTYGHDGTGHMGSLPAGVLLAPAGGGELTTGTWEECVAGLTPQEGQFLCLVLLRPDDPAAPAPFSEVNAAKLLQRVRQKFYHALGVPPQARRTDYGRTHRRS